MQVRTSLIRPSNPKEAGTMKNLALVAVLLGVVSMPAFAQNKYIVKANPALSATTTQVQAEKDKQAAAEKTADGAEAATDATGAAATDAPATGDAATDADAATGATATDAATGEPATDAAAAQDKT
jgi:hypothetical protein